MSQLHDARILLIEDDPASAEYITYVLEGMAGATVVHHTDPVEALGDLARRSYDAVITDIMLPGIDGIEFLRRVQPLQPSVPVIVITAFATVDVAVEAVQSRAAGFLRKPFTPDELIERIESQVAASRRQRPRQRVLAVGAHPDDVEIGAGATLLRHKAAGDEITIAVVSRGVRGGDESTRAVEARAAAEMLGADLIVGDLEDTRIPEGNPTVGFIEEAVVRAEPTIVYTHSLNDVHQDHRNTHRAAMVAARRVPTVYCFQSPSATVGFSPGFFVGVDNHIGGKLDLIALHASQAETRPYMDPRLIEATARYWGRFDDGDHAEAFEVVRDRGALFGGGSDVAA